MQIELISFGKISEFISNQGLQIEGIRTTEELKQHLEELFPDLAHMKYTMALNKTLVQSNSELNNNDTIAIMPPFSGG